MILVMDDSLLPQINLETIDEFISRLRSLIRTTYFQLVFDKLSMSLKGRFLTWTANAADKDDRKAIRSLFHQEMTQKELSCKVSWNLLDSQMIFHQHRLLGNSIRSQISLQSWILSTTKLILLLTKWSWQLCLKW